MLLPYRAADTITLVEDISMPTLPSDWFADASDTHTIELDQNHWVKVKRHFSLADQDRLTQGILEMEFDVEGTSRAERRRARRDNQVKAKYNHSDAILLLVAIVDWSFQYDDGTKVPVNAKTIGGLRPELAAFIRDEIDALDPLGSVTTP